MSKNKQVYWLCIASMLCGELKHTTKQALTHLPTQYGHINIQLVSLNTRPDSEPNRLVTDLSFQYIKLALSCKYEN